MSFKLNRYQHRGFTLLEMVLVLFLIGLMASATLLLTEGVEDQAKYDETKHRLAMIRQAIIGDTTRTINGRPEISGFASDMGRLPDCIRELLTQRNCADDADLVDWQQDGDSEVWSGWRGPYLAGNTEINGEVHYRDGYGNTGGTVGVPTDDWQNSGWTFTENAGNLTIISDGFDITDNIDDIPRPAGVQELLVSNDYQVTLGSDWGDVQLEIVSESGSELFIPQGSLRLKLNSPADGVILNHASAELDTANERNASSVFSSAFPASNTYIMAATGNIEVTSTATMAFDPDVTLTAGDSIILTANTIITYTNAAGDTGQFSLNDNCLPTCSLMIPSDTERNAKIGGSPVPEPTSGTAIIDELAFTATNTITPEAQTLDTEILTASSLAKSTIAVPVGSALLANTLTLPSGATITLANTNATLIDTVLTLPTDTITVSEAFTRAGNTITTNGTGDSFTIPANTPAATGNTLTIPATLTITSGEKSLSVVCELATAAEQGQLFDGDCTDNVTNTIDSAKRFTLVPRHSVPLNDSILEWMVP